MINFKVSDINLNLIVWNWVELMNKYEFYFDGLRTYFIWVCSEKVF